MSRDDERPRETARSEPLRADDLATPSDATLSRTDATPMRRGGSLRPVAIALKEHTSEHFAEVRRALSDLRVAPAVARPERAAHLQRFIYGFGLPLRILRALFRDPAVKRTYLRVILAQLAIIFVIGLASVLLGRSRDAFSGDLRHDFARVLALASAFYATLGAVEWTVVALSRQYHDQLSRKASLLSGAPPEDPEATPRIKLDVRWMGRKLKRKLRGLIVVSAGLPAVAVASLVPFAGKFLYPLLALSWTIYWVGVFTASKSAYAWRSEGAPFAPEPWFLRVADRATKQTFIGRLGLPRLYVVVWRNLSSGMFPPARELEDHPYELFGIAAFRALLALLGTYLFFRPILPVAAAHVLCTPLPSEQTSISAQASSANDSESEPRTAAALPAPGRLPDFAPFAATESAPLERFDRPGFIADELEVDPELDDRRIDREPTHR
jgi:hypothetical protein